MIDELLLVGNSMGLVANIIFMMIFPTYVPTYLVLSITNALGIFCSIRSVMRNT
jgi:hypothetical protein